MQSEDRDRLIRVEMKIDALLPHVKTITRLDKDISFIKKSLGIVWTGIVGLVGIIATSYFSKH